MLKARKFLVFVLFLIVSSVLFQLLRFRAHTWILITEGGIVTQYGWLGTMEWSDILQIAFTSGVVSAVVSGGISYLSGKKLQEETRVYERIQTYLDDGLSPITTAVSEYGTGTVFALVDLRKSVVRHRIAPEKQSLQKDVDEIKRRKIVTDLISRDLSLATKWFPKLQRFGSPLYAAVKRTLQVYGDLLADTLNMEHLLSQTNDLEKFSSGLAAVSEILQLTEIYLERRFTEIEGYVSKKKFNVYDDFLGMFSEVKYRALLTEIENYLKELDAWANALTSAKSTDRETTSMSLSKWLYEHMDLTPLS